MVKPFLSLVACAFLAASTAAVAQTSYVFQLPGLAQNGLTPQVTGLGDNDFHRIIGPSSNASFAGATKVLATPDGSRFYILTSGGILAANSTFSSVTPLSAIAGAVSDAQVSPDGKYLFVVASHLYIVNTSTGAVAADTDTGVPSGATPVAVAFSHDSQTAWVLSNATTGSSLTAVDLNVLQVAPGQLSLLSGATSMVLSPRGLLYVTTAANKLFEIEPVSMSITPLGQITVPGLAGPLQFTPDGNFAYFVNRNSCGTCSPIFKLTVQAHAITGWLPSDGSAPPAVDQVFVAGNNRVFGWSSTFTALYDITPSPLTLSVTSLGQLPTTDVAAVAVSNESPSARYLYLLFNGSHNFDRISLATNGVDQVSTLDPVNGTILSFVPIPATSGGASLTQINPSQTAGLSAPVTLIGQLLDSAGRPVFGATANFSADPTSGIAITRPTVLTTSGGWAQTIVTTPSVPGNYTVSLIAGGQLANFQLAVSATGSGGNNNGGNVPQMTIYAGDGQLLRQHESTGFTDSHVPLTVKIVDETGQPLPNVQVTFAVVEGIGTVSPLNLGLTDASGLAKAHYTSDNIPGQATQFLSKVAATSVYGSVEFFEVTHDAPANALKPPNSILLTPVNTRIVSVPQGGVLPAGITVQTYAENTGLFIPNVGLRLADPSNPTNNSPVATCQGLSRGDNLGVSRCDVQITSCQQGDFGVFLYVGEYQAFSLTLRVTSGSPALITPVTALSQTGKPGDNLNLVARVSDGCGQPIAASGLAWGIVQGSAPATLFQAQSSSDSGGTITAHVTLGQSAGLIQVQLSGPNLTPIVFNITNQISLAGIAAVTPLPPSVIVGQAFQPLSFRVRDANNNPVSGVLVTFSVSGSASINPGTATSDAQGLVQTTVTAGATPGNIVVSATASGITGTATLTSRAAGPTLTVNSFTNAASGSVGMTPCGFVTVTGAGVAPGVQGVVAAATFFGAYPYTLAGLSISVNGIPAPIQAVANDQFGQRANFQAPCELTGGTATVVVTASGATTTITGVLVLPVQPGTFTYTGPNNKVYGAVIREVNGTYVTATNPARQGEKLYVVVTGLGQTTPTLITNSVGTGSQNVNVPMLVFLNGHAVPALSARYLFGWVGAYLVEFQVPADAAVGFDQSLLAVALVNNNQDFVVGNTSLIPAVSANDTGTGTGGTGTGTGGTDGGGTGTGGTGTGGGGTGTGGATAPTQDEINSWIARGNYTSGQLSLTRSTAFTTTDNLLGGAPSTTSTKTDSFSGQFTKTSGADLSKLLNNQLPAGFPVLNPAVGSCVVYSITSLTNPFPNLTTVGLDAGPQLTSNGPNGTQFALRQNTQGVGFTYNATNVPNTYLAAGRYALSGPGGADIGVFSGNLDTVADLVVTNPDNFKVINRNGGITVNWTGGEQSSILTISGSSFTLNVQTGTISGNAFVCTQNVSAGQFTVPANILTQLAASPVTTAGGVSIITRGSFSVTASGKGARFTAPSGVDILTANNSWLWTFTPQYQ